LSLLWLASSFSQPYSLKGIDKKRKSMVTAYKLP